MKISELARQTQTDVETIRYYERTGLLPAPPRLDNGYREYLPEHVEMLGFIRHCRSLDMPLADVRRLAELAHDDSVSCEDANHLIEAHLSRVHAKIHALQTLEQQLLKLQAQCHTQRSAPQCGILKNLMRGAHGEDCACHTGISHAECNGIPGTH